jgi:nucleotide-binding universal stress UspA family protein
MEANAHPLFFLPVATYPDPTTKLGLGRALSMACKLGAGVTALIQEVDIAPIHSVVGEAVLGVSRLAGEAEARSRARATDIRQWLEERADRLAVPIAVQTVRCRPEGFTDHLLLAARCHDLTISIVDAGDPQRLAETKALIFESGGAVLAIPSLESSIPIAEQRTIPLNVLVAWDGGRASARSIRDAVPILQHADSVHLLTVDDDKAVPNPEGIINFLTHHGIRAKPIARLRGQDPIGDTLQAVAVSLDADLLVMGAYGHNRLREFVLGGATRTILHGLRLPVLMSH